MSNRNRYRGRCRVCHEWVLPGEGYASGKPGAWVAIHHNCIPVAIPEEKEK